MLTFVAAVAVVLLVSFLCSIFESVLLSITRPQVEMLVRSGRRAGTLLAGFKQNMDVPIAAILILNTAAHTVGAAVAGASYSNVFDPSTLWIFSLLFTLAVLLFTEIIPKTLGVSYAQPLAGPVSVGIYILTLLLKPLVLISERLSRSLRSKDAMPITSAEEIRLLAMLGRSEGAVNANIASLIVGATHLRDLQAHDVMLPREQVTFLHAGMDRDAVLNRVRTTRHSRFPFSPTNDFNDVTGMILVKSLFDWLLQHPEGDIDWEAVRQEPLIVPGSAALPALLRTFQESRRHLAIIVDEYGSAEGIATLEDVLEEVVGDIQDESDKPSNDLAAQPDGSLHVAGQVDLRRLSKRLGEPWSPEADVNSIGGFVAETLERIPVQGDVIEWQGYRVEVLQADAKRALLVAVSKPEAAAPDT
ncbi:MAG: hemolysin family protein [Gammaproteobacteria bacterium]|jgi:CBS domain containing-hemolysin-like protein|nr:hemolysin family protein [Gammaproteobacteria bacterium]